jgi:CRISPR/Cas system CMR-associated protein Cmr5 small subunit
MLTVLKIGLPHPCTPPPWSSTEVNTPTEVSTPAEVIAATRGHSSVDTDTPTNANVSFQAQTSSTHCPSSPHIRPTFLARRTNLERENALKAQHVREMLEALPNELVLEILSGSRVQNLLAIQHGPALAETPFGSDHITVNKVKQTVTGHMDMDKYTDEYFDQKVKQAFKSLVHQRLDLLVHDQLPLATELFFKSAVEDLRDQFYEDCKMNEASLRETVDEGCTTLHDETEKCTTEINDLIQDRLDELEHQSSKFKISTGEQLACLGYWFDQFAESNGNKEHVMKMTERCMSV